MKKWRSYIALLVMLLIASLLVPRATVDPWGLLNPYKLIRIIFILTALQILSSVLMSFLRGRQAGVLVGFLGGLVSSTALTASLAKQSHKCSEDETRLLCVSFLGALLGMVLEAAILFITAVEQVDVLLLMIFAVPIATTLLLLVVGTSAPRMGVQGVEFPMLSIKSVLTLSMIIMLFLICSEVLQKYFGESGQYILTYITSHFELHGSIIGNTQLFHSGAISRKTLGDLFALGILSSYIAKTAISVVVGSLSFKIRVLKYSAWLCVSLAVGWGLCRMFLMEV